MLTFIDWLELRLQGEPNVEYLKRLGYNPIFDKGTRSHFHKFETDDYVLMWGIKSPCIKNLRSHKLNCDDIYGTSIAKSILETLAPSNDKPHSETYL